jgi:hypothetical protein
MRRALSILLVLLFGAGPLSFAFTANDETSLPACCRRHGAHHCAMDDQRAQSLSGYIVLKARSRCPHYPQHATARISSHAAVFGAPAAPSRTAAQLTCSRVPANSFKSIHLRTPALRGPPAAHLI